MTAECGGFGCGDRNAPRIVAYPSQLAEAYAARMEAGLGAETVQKSADAAIAAEAKRRKAAEVGDIPHHRNTSRPTSSPGPSGVFAAA